MPAPTVDTITSIPTDGNATSWNTNAGAMMAEIVDTVTSMNSPGAYWNANGVRNLALLRDIINRFHPALIALLELRTNLLTKSHEIFQGDFDN